MEERGTRVFEIEKVSNIGSVDHHPAEQGEFRDWRPDPGALRAQLTAVERHWLKRTAAHRRTRVLLLVVGMGGIGPKLDVGLRLQCRDRVRAGPQEGLTQARRGPVPDRTVEEVRSVLEAVVGVDTCRMWIARHPGRRGGERRSPTDILRALHNEHASVRDGGENARRHASGARAYDNQVVSGAVRY